MSHELPFGKKVELMRKLRGLSQSELARQFNDTNRFTIWEIEIGKLMPWSEGQQRIKAALGWHDFTDLGLAIIAAEEFPPVVEQMLRELEAVMLGKRELEAAQ